MKVHHTVQTEVNISSILMNWCALTGMAGVFLHLLLLLERDCFMKFIFRLPSVSQLTKEALLILILCFIGPHLF